MEQRDKSHADIVRKLVSHGDDRVGIVGPFASYRREPLAAAGEAVDDRAGAIRLLVQQERKCAPEPVGRGQHRLERRQLRYSQCFEETQRVGTSGGSHRTPRTR